MATNIHHGAVGLAAPPVAAASDTRLLRKYQMRVEQLEGQVRDLSSSFICCLNQLLDLRDLNTGVHSTRLAEWGLRVGRDLGVDERHMRDLEMGALLHDIGKIGVPDGILNKPSKLTPEEYEQVKRHPEYGWTAIRNLPGLEHTSLFVLHHHENFDGTGYPAGLKGSETPVGARIVSVIDAFDAMVSSRPYRKGLPVEEAIRRLHQASGTQFDPEVVRSFTKFASDEMQAVLSAVGVTEADIF